MVSVEGLSAMVAGLAELDGAGRGDGGDGQMSRTVAEWQIQAYMAAARTERGRMAGVVEAAPCNISSSRSSCAHDVEEEIWSRCGAVLLSQDVSARKRGLSASPMENYAKIKALSCSDAV
jgi:hypothetical protein